MSSEVFKNYKLYAVMNSNDYLEIGDFHSGYAKAYHRNKICGYIDISGYETLLYEYDEVGDFCQFIAPVRYANKWGFINKSFDEIIEPRYVFLRPYNNGFIVKETFESDFIVINSNGEEIYRTNNIDYAMKRLSTPLPKIESPDVIKKEYTIPFSTKKESIYYDVNGNKIIPYSNQECRDFSEGYVIVKIGYDDIRIYNEKGKQLKVHTCFSINAITKCLEGLINKFILRITNKIYYGYSCVIDGEYYCSDTEEEIKVLVKTKRGIN